MEYSLLADMATLTTLPMTNLSLLAKKANYIICNDVEETLLSDEDITEIDIGIGTLKIFVDKGNVNYCFAPSKELDKSIKKTIIDGNNPLVELADKTLTTRFLNAYKDFI